MSTSPTGVPEFDLADRMRKALRASGVGAAEMADYLDVSRYTQVSDRDQVEAIRRLGWGQHGHAA